MHALPSLHEVSGAFREGGLADRVILTLARAEAGRELQNEDRDALQHAVDFLSQAKRGYNWLSDPQVSRDSRAWARSFGTAARSLDRRTRDAEFLGDIEQMLQVVTQLRTTGIAESEPLKCARVFFNRVLRSAIDHIDAAISARDINDPGAPEWVLANSFGT